MKAMILAAGMGTRLGSLTHDMPKCLMTAGSKTMLEHAVDRLKQIGVSSLVINIHHLAQQVREFVHAKNNFGITVRLSEEAQLLGTGGGVKKVEDFFKSEKSFLVYNADVFTDLDLSQLIKQHNASSAIATLACMQRKESTYLLFEKDGVLRGFEDSRGVQYPQSSAQLQLEKIAFSGIQILSPQIFEYMRALPEQFSIIDAYLQATNSGKKVMSFRMDGCYWVDIGTVEKLEELRAKLNALENPTSI